MASNFSTELSEFACRLAIRVAKQQARLDTLRAGAKAGAGTILEAALGREADALEAELARERARLDVSERGYVLVAREDIRFALENSHFIGRATREGRVLYDNEAPETLLDRA